MDAGETDIDTGGKMVTPADADFAVLARLVAVTEQDPCDDGGVYRPLEEIVPQLALQVTDVSGAPVTVEENCRVWSAKTMAEDGEMPMITGQTTVTVADEEAARFAWLVAVTLQVAGPAGLEYKPELEIAPQEADQLTAVFEVPETEAENCRVLPMSSVAEEGATLTFTFLLPSPQPRTITA
jgi:hypothetical protein